MAMRWSYPEKNFKVNNLVDILRESKNKKVLGCNWNEDPAYGLGKGRDTFTAKGCFRPGIFVKYFLLFPQKKPQRKLRQTSV